MKIEDFLTTVDDVLDKLKSEHIKEAFASNMEHLKVDNKSFASWMMTYLAWNELETEEDCRAFYWHLEDDEEDDVT